MSYARKSDIIKLLKSDLSSYRISKDTGISQVSVNKYRNGDAALDNMTLGNAIKLQQYYDKVIKNGEVSKVTREESFGRALGILTVMSEGLFEKGKPAVDVLYMNSYANKPMSTFAKAHADVMQYATTFQKREFDLIDRLNNYISELDESTFNDTPLEPKFLVYQSQEITTLKSKIKGDE